MRGSKRKRTGCSGGGGVSGRGEGGRGKGGRRGRRGEVKVIGRVRVQEEG